VFEVIHRPAESRAVAPVVTILTVVPSASVRTEVVLKVAEKAVGWWVATLALAAVPD
jgi:hypothetical protein